MAPKDKDAVDLTAESDKKKDASTTKKGNGKKTEEEIAEEALSEEDKELKERLETCVSTLLNKEKETAVTVPLRLQALDVIVTELRTSTSSMTSVPKPLKFLRPHFVVLKELHTTIAKEGDAADNDGLELRQRLADVLAVLAMTMAKPEDRESLKFKLAAFKDYDMIMSRGVTPKTVDDNLGSWGHEFVRSLAGEIGQEYSARVLDGADPDEDETFADLMKMVDVIVPFHVTHNAEAEAVDLLIEVQRLKKLLELDSLDENNFGRICLYLVKTADYMADPDDHVVCNVLLFVESLPNYFFEIQS
jgi:26S proteasome regulatory subunit N1